MSTKARVFVTIQAHLLREADVLGGRMSRSAVFEQTLAARARRRRQVEIAPAIEADYRALTASEEVEDEKWTGLGDDTAPHIWDRPKR